MQHGLHLVATDIYTTDYGGLSVEISPRPLAKPRRVYYNIKCTCVGGVAQSGRASGSYPLCQWFKSTHRHQVSFH